MAKPVTDPALLALLDGGDKGSPVQDPALLAILNNEPGGEKTPKAEDKSTLQTIREAIHAPTRILENGFLMGLGDRARAGMDAIIGNGSYGSNLKNEQGQTDQYGADHPVAAPVINAVGGAAAPLGVLGAAGNGASLGAKTLYGAGAGAGIGAFQGAAGSKDWTDLPQTFKDAAVGAGVGGILGGILPGTGKAIGSTYNAVANALTRTEGMSKAAAKPLIEALAADGPQAVQGEMQRLGPDAMLADGGPSFLGKAQGAILNSDEGRSGLGNPLTTRNKGTNQRIMGDVDRALGPAEDPQTVTSAIRARRSEVDNQAYPAALNNAPDVDVAPILRQVDAMIPKSVGMEQKALVNLRGMLATSEQKAGAAAQPSGVTGAPVKPAGNSLAADVEAIRTKYGDAAAAAYQRQQAPQGAPSLLEFLASKGGLGPDAELEAIGAHGHVVNVEGAGRRKLVKQGGQPLDYAREAAEEAGYLRGDHNGTSSVNDLLDAIDAEMRGQKRYPEGFAGSVTKREASAMSAREQHEYDRHIQGFEDDLAAAGHGEIGPDVKSRAVHLMANEGMDADSAVDHAVRKLDQESGFPGDRPQAASSPAPTLQKDATVLHKIKQELDNVIEYDQPGLGIPAGALTRQQGVLKHLRGKLNETLENQVPGYREANRQSAALADRGEAVEAGTQYLGSGKTTPSPERFAAEFSPLSQGEKIAFAKGSRGEIQRILGTNPNDLVATKRALQGTDALGEPTAGWNAQKLATVHGDNAVSDVLNSVDRNLKFRDTYNKVVENSQTAQRTASAKAMKPDPSSETPFITPQSNMSGMLATGAKKAIVGVANALLKSDPTRSYGEVARILSAQGGQRDAHLAALVDALSRRQGHSAMAENVGNRSALIAAMLGNGYAQSGPMRRRAQQ